MLEAIVGDDFLPRGTGIVTRIPLILQHYDIDREKDYAFTEYFDKKLINFDISKNGLKTIRVVGDNKTINH